MLHVLIILLKIIGILLALAIGLAVLILAAPIRYSFRLQADEDTSPSGQIKVTWLLRIIYVKVSYIDKIFDYRVRIFGYQIWGNQKEFLEKRQKKKKKRQRKKEKKTMPAEEPQLKALSLPEKEKEVSEKEPAAPMSGQTENEDTVRSKTAPSEPKKKARMPKKKKTGSKKRWIPSIREKIDDVKKAWNEYHGAQLLDFAKKSIIKVLKHILPRKLRGYLRFGLEDPAWTGIITGMAAMFYPCYYKSFTLEPDFGERCFAADCTGKGRVHIGFFLYIGITALMNRDVRAFIKKLL